MIPYGNPQRMPTGFLIRSLVGILWDACGSYGNPMDSYGVPMGSLWGTFGNHLGFFGIPMAILWRSWGASFWPFSN